MKKLTTKFITAAGFGFIDVTHEDEFYYKHYASTGLFMEVDVFFNYFADGSVTYEVMLEDWELENVGEDELLMLLKVLPSAGV